jgi:uncharacterized protein (DUF58 family)
MNARRWIFAGTALLLLFAGLYTGERLYFMGFFIQAAFVFYAALTSLWVLLDFKYLQTIEPARASKGQQAVLTIQIHNDKPFIFPYIKVHYHTPASVLSRTPREGVLSILPFRYGEIREEFSCSLRGQYPLGIVRIEVGDIFGLFSFPLDLTNKTYHKVPMLTVYPRVLRLSSLPLPEILQEGSVIHQLQRTEEAASLADIREYRFGDPLKRIHWKLSSKLQQIQVKNFEITTQPHTLMFIETTPPKLQGLAQYQVEDQMIEAAAAVLNYILMKWLPVMLVVYQKERRTLSGREPQNFQTFFEYVSGLAFDSGFSMDQVMSLESAALTAQGSMILIIHTLTYSLFNHLILLKRSGVYPMVFLVQHRREEQADARRMIRELYDKAIPAFLLYTDQRLDETLEAIQ